MHAHMKRYSYNSDYNEEAEPRHAVEPLIPMPNVVWAGNRNGPMPPHQVDLGESAKKVFEIQSNPWKKALFECQSDFYGVMIVAGIIVAVLVFFVIVAAVAQNAN